MSQEGAIKSAITNELPPKQEDERCGRLTLVDLLTQPLQRLTRYPLLLKAISKQARSRAVQPAETL